MITEERLKELTKERKDFFEASIYDDIPRKINIKEIDISKPFVFYDDENGNAERVFYNLLSGQLCSVDLERIFETEEEACWELEMTATRTETFAPPIYEEFENNNDIVPVYTKKHLIYHLYYYIDKFKGKIILIERVDAVDNDIIFNKPLTKENYIDACKLCLRLLKGEEV